MDQATEVQPLRALQGAVMMHRDSGLPNKHPGMLQAQYYDSSISMNRLKRMHRSEARPCESAAGAANAIMQWE